MKKGLRKLILSGTALAAVAATLGTSTYAWYTTNPTVSATNILGQAKADGDASISIAQEPAAGQNKKWATTVAMTTANLGEAYLNLVPIALKYTAPTGTATTGGTTTFHALNPAASSAGYLADATSTDYVAFRLYFKTSPTEKDVPLFLKSIKVGNTSTAAQLKSHDNLLYTGSGTSRIGGVLPTDPTYQVDIRDSLAMVMTSSTAGTVTYDSDGKYASKTAVDLHKYAYALEPYKDSTLTTASFGDDLISAANEDAVTYYNTVMNKTIKYGADANSGYEGETFTAANADTPNTTAIAVLPAAGTEAYVDFKIYLNGWDKGCYDACKGQAFKVEMEFTSDKTLALGYKTN